MPDSYALSHNDNTIALGFAKERITNSVSQRDTYSHPGELRPGSDTGQVRVQAADSVRRRIGASIFERVAGPEGPNRRRVIHQAEGDRWFAEDRPIRRVHGDSSMFVGGIRALLLQSLHPLAMAGVDAHSGYRGDPWGRLQRTSYFLAVTTFGRAATRRRRPGGSRRSTAGSPGRRRTAGPTRHRIRTC